MAANARGTRSQIVTLTVPNGSWSAPQKLQRLGISGLLTQFRFRAPASSTVTEVEVMVWVGDEDDDTTVTTPDTQVTAAYQVFYRTAIAVTGNAITADDDHALDPKALYDLIDRYAGPSGERNHLWFAIKGSAGSDDQDNCEVLFQAQDVE